jgi:hypothetical protein
MTTTVPVETAAEKLKRLKTEYDTLSARLEDIRNEVKQIYGNLDKLAPPGVLDSRNGRRAPVKSPRPVEDRVSIAAGRAIEMGKRHGKSKEECRALGIAAAKKKAKKLGIEQASSEITKLVDKKIKAKFS